MVLFAFNYNNNSNGNDLHLIIIKILSIGCDQHWTEETPNATF